MGVRYIDRLQVAVVQSNPIRERLSRLEVVLHAMGYSDSKEERILEVLDEVCSRSFRIPLAKGAHQQRFSRVSRRRRCRSLMRRSGLIT